MGRWRKIEVPPEGARASAKEMEDKAFNLYAEMLIDKIEKTAKSEWKQPWFAEGQLAWPKSLYGKPYHGMNAMMLTMLCEQKGWRIPIFATHDRIFNLNKQVDENGQKTDAVDKDGNKLPFVHVMKGEHSFPVFLTQLNIVHRETKEKIKWADYQRLSSEEQQEYNLYHNRYVHFVFNVDQTNLQEARPELYAKLEKENVPQKLEDVEGEEFKFEPLDVMIDKNLWICPVKVQELKAGESPHYSIKANEVVIGTKAQYQATGHPESWAGDLTHELAHATGHKDYLNRFEGERSRDSYAREEIVAEMSSAIVCQHNGIKKYLSEDTIPYVQGWLKALHEQPDFIRTIMKEIKAATNIIESKIDEVRRLYLGEDDRQTRDGDKLDVREEDEATLEYDETGDAHLAPGESLGADKKQGESESPVLGIAAEPEPGERRGMHR